MAIFNSYFDIPEGTWLPMRTGEFPHISSLKVTEIITGILESNDQALAYIGESLLLWISG